MAICTDCATAGDLDRQWQDELATAKAEDRLPTLTQKPEHPTSCGCPCRHYPAKEWEDYFSAPRPSTEESSSKS